MGDSTLLTGLAEAMNSVGLGGELSGLQRLTGGANKESWRFEIHYPNGSGSYVLRRNTVAQTDLCDAVGFGQPNLLAEAALLHALQGKGLQIPRVVAEFGPESVIGEAFVMTFEPGESLPNRILRSSQYESARGLLTAQCGQQLAVLHGLELDRSLAQWQPDLSIEERISHLQLSSERLGNTSPVYALGFDWLRQHIPDPSRRCVIHGDFRLGNLLVTESGLSSILDWELAKLSSPEEDLGYLSANAWRFAQPHNPVGGFGQYEELLDAYEQAAGWRPSMSALKYWQFFTSISWGIICLAMRQIYLDGTDRPLERLAIGRRFSAAELDILLLLDELS